MPTRSKSSSAKRPSAKKVGHKRSAPRYKALQNPAVKDYDVKRIPGSWPAALERPRDVFMLALQGASAKEIRERLFPTMFKGHFSKHYMTLVKQAREMSPNARKRIDQIRYRGAERRATLVDLTELRRLAATTAPDTVIAIKLGIPVDKLRSLYKQVIDEERANLGVELATKLVAKARGTDDEKDRNGKVIRPGIPADMVLIEKLLNRIGFMDAPMQSAIEVEISFAKAAAPEVPSKITVKQGGKMRPLLDLGDDDGEDAE